MYSVFARAAAISILAGGLLMPTLALAASSSDPGTGTLVGAVTCGPDEDTPAAHIVVSAVGLNVQTVTDSAGRFSLGDVPAGQSMTIDASADPQNSLTASRFNVTVQSGQTLDIGSMDLGICGQAAPAQGIPVDNNSPADFSQSGD
jgi:hypothetical protein